MDAHYGGFVVRLPNEETLVEAPRRMSPTISGPARRSTLPVPSRIYRLLSRPQGPGGPARAYRYRLALRRSYRTASAATGWVRVDGVAEVCRGFGWLG